ncbi:Uu.00g030080.m01.CDS01 [Anthostomella pinea]|uniref:N-alpha-acetyltransferase 40 n=1 Tax=Anthostomella pinea TaxID=933095 RepID=A0AAI8V991_9PEZI|nr:Uu.00g030080.m01.CDS01 [Anthostomella pinea]
MPRRRTPRRSQPVDIPLHALPLRLARRQQVAYLAQVGDAAVALELGAREAARIGAVRRVGDAPRAAQDGAVEREGAGALEELRAAQGCAAQPALVGRACGGGIASGCGDGGAQLGCCYLDGAHVAVCSIVDTLESEKRAAHAKISLSSEQSWTEWTNPKTQAIFSLSLVRAGNLSQEDLKACFDLIEETSRADYEPSSFGWKPSKKLAEMKSPDLRYILVKDVEGGGIRGFTSLMPTFEEGEPVVYCYEIHLKPELQGTGLGKLLMSFQERVAANTPPIKKVMLTCFVSNNQALGFYRKFGFETDRISPEPRKLRFGKLFVPDYVIMSKVVETSRLPGTSP